MAAQKPNDPPRTSAHDIDPDSPEFAMLSAKLAGALPQIVPWGGHATKEQVLVALRRRDIDIDARMLDLIVHCTTPDPDGKARIGGIQVATSYEHVDRGHYIFMR